MKLPGMCYDAECKGFVETLLEKLGNVFSCNDQSRRKLSSVLKSKLLEAGEETSPLVAEGKSNPMKLNLYACISIIIVYNFLPLIINLEATEKLYGAVNNSKKKRSHRLSLAEVLSLPHPIESLDSSSFSSTSKWID